MRSAAQSSLWCPFFWARRNENFRHRLLTHCGCVLAPRLQKHNCNSVPKYSILIQLLRRSGNRARSYNDANDLNRVIYPPLSEERRQNIRLVARLILIRLRKSIEYVDRVAVCRFARLFVEHFVPSAEGSTIFSWVSAFLRLSVLKPSSSCLRSPATLGRSFRDGAAGATGTGQDIWKDTCIHQLASYVVRGSRRFNSYKGTLTRVR